MTEKKIGSKHRAQIHEYAAAVGLFHDIVVLNGADFTFLREVDPEFIVSMRPITQYIIPNICKLS